ncbi:MAG: NCS2 family permease [Gammaproteobacteria bacterium]|nr:NCS2 family permease [Gammaproteobacteria bacterium]
MLATLDRFFELKERQTNVKTELLAGLTTFLTLVYIVFVNPTILAEAGMNHNAVFVATCLAAAFGCLVMGLYANYPIALAPGMGLNAYFAATLVISMGISWQVALGAVFCSGVLFLILSILPIREMIINSIPKSQKMAIAAGIGVFLILVALRSANLMGSDLSDVGALGNFAQWSAVLVLVGFVVMVVLDAKKIPGSLALVILAIAIVCWLVGLAPVPNAIVSGVPSLNPTFMQLDIGGALSIGLVAIVFALLLVDLFDTSGTLVAVLHQANMLDEQGRIKKLRHALLADSSATIFGSLVGTSTTTSYIESAAGIRVGGRTGLTAVAVGALFLLTMLFAPIATSIPAYATAPAILFVGCAMAKSLGEVEWGDLTEAMPAVITAFAIPFSGSIATGIGIGFITYVLTKTFAGQVKSIHPAMGVIAAVFVVKFIFL